MNASMSLVSASSVMILRSAGGSPRSMTVLRTNSLGFHSGPSGTVQSRPIFEEMPSVVLFGSTVMVLSPSSRTVSRCGM